MGAKYKEYGGGPAVGLGQQWTDFLGSFLNNPQGNYATPGNGGSFPMGAMAGAGANGGGIQEILQSILSPGAGKIGGALNSLLQSGISRQGANLRAQFGAGGGTSYGTPAAVAESLFGAQAAPEAMSAIGNLQMGAINSILPFIQNTAMRGITQRQGVMSPSDFTSAMQSLAPVLGTVGNIFAPGAGSGIEALMGMIQPNALGPAPNPSALTSFQLPSIDTSSIFGS